jgi:hypothetical protein
MAAADLQATDAAAEIVWPNEIRLKFSDAN